VVRSRKARDRTTDDLLRCSNEKKQEAPQPGADRRPPKTGERLVDDLFNLDEKTKIASATAYALPAKSAGSAPAVQCSRSLRKSLRDRLQFHDRGMLRKNKSRMPCFVQTGAPQKAGERLTDENFSLGRQAIRRRRTLRSAT